MIIDSPIVSGSYAASGSFNQFGDVVISGSLTVTGSIIGTASNATTASFAATASYAANVPITASYALSASQATTASYLSGYVSPFPFTGSAIISGSLGITGSLSVTNFSGSGVRYLVTDASGSVTAQTASAVIKTTQAFTATGGQTTFAVTNGYSTGYVDVFINGSKLNATEFTDTSGTNIVLTTGSFVDDVVEVVKYLPASGVSNNVLRQQTVFTASAGQTVFSASYTPGLLDIFLNGSKLAPDDYTANNGTTFTLATASAANDVLDVFVYSYQVGSFSGIGGVGTANQLAYFGTTNSITGSPNFTVSGSAIVITGSLIVSSSSTFTNIGPTVLSGSVGVSGSLAVGGVSVVLVNQTSSLSVSTASFASTASSADNFLARGTITAQTLVVQTITSSVDFVTGSTRFGSLSSNTHQFTGSLYVTGALYVDTGSVTIGAVTPTSLLTMKAVVTGSSGLMYFENAPTYSSSSVRMWFDNLDTFFISKGGGTDRIGFALANGGNVGIGNTNPQAYTNYVSLTIGDNSASKIGLLKFRSSYNSGDGAEIYQTTGGTLQFAINGSTTVMSISGSRVGIGTSIPLSPLHIQLSDTGVGTKTIVSTLERAGASTSGTQREVGLVFKDGNNPTLVGGIAGVRFNSAGNYYGGLKFYVQASNASPATTFSDLTAALTIDYAGAATFSSTINAGVITGDSNSTGVPSIVAKVGGGGNNGTYGFGNSSDYRIRGGSDYAAMIFDTAGSERMRINQYGQLLINATSSTYSSNLYGYNLGVRGNNNQTFISIARANQNLDSEGIIFGLDTTQASLVVFDNIPLKFNTSGSERMRITSGGNVLINTTSNNGLRLGEKLNVSTLNDYGGIAITTYAGSSAGRSSVIDLNKSRGTSDGSMTAVANGDEIGYLIFRGSDGTNFVDGAYIRAEVEGTVSANSVPMLLKFHTGPSGTTERMRITSGGVVQITNPSDAQLSLAASGTSAYVRFSNSAGDVWGIGNSFSAANTDFQLYNFTTAAYGFRVSRGGIYANTTAAAANVQIDSNGYFARSTSSSKYKNSITNYDKGLDIVNQLRPVYYKGNNDGDKQFAGLIAEEVHNLGLTEFVQYAEDGSPDALAYQNMVALLTKAIQELKSENDSLKSRIEILENK